MNQLLEQASDSEDIETRSTRLIAKGDLSGALELLKKATINDGGNSQRWRGLAHILDLMGESEKSKTAKDHAERIESKAIAEKTGRKMEDILADLLDDGILNFSAGSDTIPTNASPKSTKDDLTKLPGIGAVSSKRLNMAGINTFEQVSKMSDSKIMEIINAKKLDVWSEMARKILEDQ